MAIISGFSSSSFMMGVMSRMSGDAEKTASQPAAGQSSAGQAGGQAGKRASGQAGKRAGWWRAPLARVGQPRRAWRGSAEAWPKPPVRSYGRACACACAPVPTIMGDETTAYSEASVRYSASVWPGQWRGLQVTRRAAAR